MQTQRLGNNQLSWCRANLRGFKTMERQAKRVVEETRKTREAAGHEKEEEQTVNERLFFQT